MPEAAQRTIEGRSHDDPGNLQTRLRYHAVAIRIHSIRIDSICKTGPAVDSHGLNRHQQAALMDAVHARMWLIRLLRPESTIHHEWLTPR